MACKKGETYLMMFRRITAFYFRHKNKHVNKFRAHIVALFNVNSRGRYINHKTVNGYVEERYQFV
jgi:hypothetical protein